MVSNERIWFARVDGIGDLFTTEFIDYLIAAQDKFSEKIKCIRSERANILEKALLHRDMPGPLPLSEINTLDWQVPPVPADLKSRGIEISGPASITGMFINALNPGPDGQRAEGYLDDDEDSAGHRLIDTVTAARNRLQAVERNLEFTNQKTGKKYSIADGELPFFMHRERGLHLDESDVTLDGKPINAAILGTCLTLFHAGQAQIKRGQGVYFYLPKMELVEEARFWREFFDLSIEHIGLPKHAVIRAIPLIESLPAVYQMEELLHALGPYAAGLNAARWDLKASIFEFVMSDPQSVWPDRFGVDVKSTEFLANIFRRLVAICFKRGGVPIGGMATALPSKDPEINAIAAKSIQSDKVWEASEGFIRAWVAHIFHMQTAADPFKKTVSSEINSQLNTKSPEDFPVEIKVPDGPVTVDGTRRNVRMLIEYLEGWLGGRGAKGIDSLEGKPGNHPALMEDLATGRMSVAQIAQRIIHSAKDSNIGAVHDFAMVKCIISEETSDIITRLPEKLENSGEVGINELIETSKRYRKSAKIAMRWIKNYTEFNFRSLGSYTRTDLDGITSSEDAF